MEPRQRVRVRVRRVRADGGVEPSGRVRRVWRPRAPWWRRPGPLLLAAAIAVVILFGMTLGAVRIAGRRLLQGREAARLGQAALEAGDAEGARDNFLAAELSFARASEAVQNPALRVLSFLPLIGRSPDTVTDIARAGTLTSRAGQILADAIDRVPRGVSAFSPVHGRVPIAPLERVGPAVHRATLLVEGARDEVARSPGTLLMGSVGDAREEALDRLREAARILGAADALGGALPSWLGADRPRRYFVGAQNPAELRGTGGYLGAYAILTIREGRFHLGAFRPIQALPNVPRSRIEPPNPSFAARYDRYGGAGFWPNINMTPDVPSSATAIERLYEEVRGVRLDGTLLVDPFALSELLAVTGQVRVPLVEASVSARTVVPYVTNRAYADLPDPDTRKRLLGDVAKEVLDRFLEGEPAVPAPEGARALLQAASGGHLLFHAADPAVQRGFARAGVTGDLRGPPGYLAIIGNNASAGKVDFYAERRVRYDVALADGGGAAAAATVELRNGAPTRGQPAYVIGPFNRRFSAGQNVTILAAYCPFDCHVTGFQRDGRREGVGSQIELGRRVYPTTVDLSAGRSQEVTWSWDLGRAWAGDDGGGAYRLTIRGQPTIRPTPVLVRVRPPSGMHVTGGSPGLRLAPDGAAVWRGSVSGQETIEVEFGRSFLARVWRAILRFLDRPVVRLGDHP